MRETTSADKGRCAACGGPTQFCCPKHGEWQCLKCHCPECVREGKPPIYPRKAQTKP